MPPTVSFKINASALKLPFRQLEKLPIHFAKQAELVLSRDETAWPAYIRAAFKPIRPKSSEGKLLNPDAIYAMWGTISDSDYQFGVHINEVLAPHWTSIEYGSVEEGQPVSRPGMPVIPGNSWPKQVRMSSRPNGVPGQFIDAPHAPTPGAGTSAFAAKGGAGFIENKGTYFMRIHKNIKPHNFVYKGMKQGWADTQKTLAKMMRGTKLKEEKANTR